MVNRSFEQAAAHLANLGPVRNIIDDLLKESRSIEGFLARLEEYERTGQDVTIRTDIRILINEIRHIMAQRKATR